MKFLARCPTNPPWQRRRRVATALLLVLALSGCSCTTLSSRHESLHDLVDKYAPSAIEWSLVPHRAETPTPGSEGSVALVGIPPEATTRPGTKAPS